MEEKVKFMLRIIEQEGDSFAKRAEMYYKRRPELITSVEESYRAYRALAERFDHLSKDLQSANRTIATVFPEQVQLSLDQSDDEDNFSASSSAPSPDRLSNRGSSPLNKNFPKAPKLPAPRTSNVKAQTMLASKRDQLRRNLTTYGTVQTPNSGLSKDEAMKQIDNYEKEILSMQTEKEFMKSAYENALAKFLELESKITESQTKVCSLQDEFGVGAVIEDHEARSLMAGSALSSCAEALAKLQEEQTRSMTEVKAEYERIKEAHEKIEALKKFSGLTEEISKEGSVMESSFKEILTSIEMDKGAENADELREKIKEELKINSSSVFTEPEMAEKIDDLVEKVVRLETTVCSQNSLVKRLRQEIDGLLGHIKILEEQKQKLLEDSAMKKSLRELEEELIKVKRLNKEFFEKKNSIDVEITGASCKVDHLQEKLIDVKPYERLEDSTKEDKADQEVAEAAQNEENKVKYSEKENYGSDFEQQSEVKEVEGREEEEEKQDMSRTAESNIESDLQLGDEEGINWRKLYMNNMEERERILVEEYTIILRDYKDMKMNLSDKEKKYRDDIFELANHVRELRNTSAAKDEEIQMLRQKLSSVQGNGGGKVDSPLEENNVEDKIDNKEIVSLGSGSQSSDLDRKPLFQHLYDRDVVIKLTEEDENDNEKAASSSEGSARRVKINTIAKTRPVSRTEGRYRAELDNLLEANLDFWLRFSTAFHQIQKFQTSIKDLQAELGKLKQQSQMKGGNVEMQQNQVKSDTRPLYKHLREIETELILWLEHSAVFQDELRSRFTSLNNIKDEITKIYSNKTIEQSELSDYQAAKFQGEILNMKHENSKVAEELQAGVSRVKALKIEIGKALIKLDKEFSFSESKRSVKNPLMKPRIPLHTFLFGMKLKRHKRQPSQTILSCVTPALSKDHHSPLPD
ncbi:protein NETWORKED 2A-like [Amaranthus tricolor]|uniref:protein NETWORKED 2A-like n=1 Tax=Amaranthus tricolor TaxID=29722 RepID=UPI002589F3B5|nr:protein NETWORKED 2A-like [Amaranthus tricolor]